jgi:hypothetical protein
MNINQHLISEIGGYGAIEWLPSIKTNVYGVLYLNEPSKSTYFDNGEFNMIYKNETPTALVPIIHYLLN